jgi:hypothetical protein
MRDHTSKLERRLQVELLWARREVFADQMNFQRYESYVARRALACPDEASPDFKEASKFVDLSFEFPSRFDHLVGRAVGG